MYFNEAVVESRYKNSIYSRFYSSPHLFFYACGFDGKTTRCCIPYQLSIAL